MRILASLSLLVLTLLYAAFIVTNNAETVRVGLLFTTFESVPLWKGLLGAFVFGMGVTGLGCGASLLRLRLRARRQAREIAGLEQEIHGLRTLPLDFEPTPTDAFARKG